MVWHRLPKKTRKVYNKARKKYNKYTTNHNKTVLQNASKANKKPMNKYIKNTTKKMKLN